MIRELSNIDDITLDNINSLRKAVSEQKCSVIDRSNYKLESLKYKRLIVSEKNELEGYLTLDTEHESSPENEIHLNVFVSPTYQGEGIGPTLITKAKKLANSISGVNKITIMVKKIKPELKPFYEKQGFKIIKESNYCWNMVYKLN